MAASAGPTETASGESYQSCDGTVSMFRIGSFNIGVDQSELTSQNAKAVLDKAENIITTCVKNFGLHIINLCEFGGHLQGLSDAGISAKDMKIVDGPQGALVIVNSNYLTSCGFNDDTIQFDVKAIRTFRIAQGGPELVVHKLENDVGFRLMLGSLHICASEQNLVVEALRKMERESPTDSATQPVVQVLVGNCSLCPEEAEDIEWRTHWHVHTTGAGQSEGVIFVKGAHTHSFDLRQQWLIDRGLSNDTHDGIAMELQVNVTSSNMPEPSSKSLSARDCEDATRPTDASQLDSGNDAASQLHGFWHEGQHYIGEASARPVFIPPEYLLVRQPQEWAQCQCIHECLRCVYDGATLCEPCTTGCYDCEPGCCGKEEDVTDSCDEGADTE